MVDCYGKYPGMEGKDDWKSESVAVSYDYEKLLAEARDDVQGGLRWCEMGHVVSNPRGINNANLHLISVTQI